MQYKDIEIFLELANTRNITKTAESLFLSQSVVSTRLKRFEEELGYELFVRSKGMREMELTRQGKEFISVAIRWKNLYEEAEKLKDRSQRMLHLATPESVYYDHIDPLVVRLMKKYPDLNISVRIADSEGIYDMMDSNIIDFGFASYESSRAGVIHEHLYAQRFCIVSYTDIDNTLGVISPRSLDPEKEIRLSGGNFSSLHIWRDKWFGEHSGARIEINSPHMMVSMLKESRGSWALLPKTSASQMSDLYGMKIYELSDAPGKKKIYLLRHDAASYVRTEASELFYSELAAYMKEISE